MAGSEDPKPSGGRSGSEDPKPSGRSDGEVARGGDARMEPSFGGGAGWLVVAFLSPVGVNVPEFAARVLRGTGSSPVATSPFTKAIASAAVDAQQKARRQARQLDATVKLLPAALPNGADRARKLATAAPAAGIGMKHVGMATAVALGSYMLFGRRPGGGSVWSDIMTKRRT